MTDRGSLLGSQRKKGGEDMPQSPATDTSLHLPLVFIGMEHLQLSATNLAEEYFLAAQAINTSDPLLLNELGVVAYNKEE